MACFKFVNRERLRTALFHLGLLGFCCGYVLAGALLFRAIERPMEESLRDDLLKALRFEADLFVERTNFLEIQEGSSFEEIVNPLIDDYQYALFQQFENPIKENYFRSLYYNNGTYMDLWTLPMAILFTTTTIIPVGFGFVAPLTTMGRAALLIYSIIGLPLALITISDIGKFFCALLFQCFKSIHVTMVAMIILLAIYPIIGAFLIYESTGMEITDCLYFCIATMFTIGFGDILPSVPLISLIVMVVVGVLLVTAGVDLLASGIIHDIHYLGRRVSEAKRLAGKMFQMAQQGSGAVGAGLSQLNAFARSNAASILKLRAGDKSSVTTSLLIPPHPQPRPQPRLNRQKSFEPKIALEYVDI